MTLFLSTHINKVDKKCRVSVPAPFRAALTGQSFQGVVLFRSNAHAALEGFPMSYMEEISRRLESFDLFSEEQDDLATSVFGEAVQLAIDSDGRIMLPPALMDFSGIGESAAFVGLGTKFQIWEPGALEARRDRARQQVREKKLTIPKAKGGV